MALGLHRTRDRTGVLLYVSEAERRAEVFADDGVYARAPPEVWGEVVDRLIAGLKRGAPADGFVSAVERTGEILSACLPPRTDDADELPNDLVTR
ncbi:MAG TPA: TPM domain-containing protein [Caulobacteraceae bacterium]|nr:TPM domain-containing protein [Caulobacteraceae bacterium]